MTYTMWPSGVMHKEQCRGITKKGLPCKHRGWDILGRGFWCPAHGTIFGAKS